MENKIIEWTQLLSVREKAKAKNKKVVFTNGVFDMLHRGHVEYLQKARELGDILIIGLNSDISVHFIKGLKRPLVNQEDRVIVLSALSCVDYVVLFNEDTPAKLIEYIMPDILVKGGRLYGGADRRGRCRAWKNGGQVIPIGLTPGKSTTELIKKIVDVYGK